MTNFKSFIILFLFSALLHQQIKAISSRIDFQINGLENKSIVFACQYGEKQLVIDTVQMDDQAKGFYESKQRLNGGIYVVVFPNNKYFDVLINEEQFFTIATDTLQTLENLIIEGSEESDLFRQYQLFVSKMQKTIRDKEKVQQNELNNQIDSLKKIVFEKYPSSFFASYLLMQQDPKMDDNSTKIASGREQFLLQRNYLKNHYFDKVNFEDNRILRTRLLYEKMSFYFNVLLSQHSDSIIKEIDQLLASAKVLEESYRYVLNFLISNYRNPQKTYQERVLIHLADNFYFNDKAPWADPRFIALLQERVNQIRNNITGNKAPNLLVQDINNKPIELHKLNAKYLLIFFFSADCPVCITEAEELNNAFLKYKNKGLEVLAFYVHADKGGINEFMNTTKYDWQFVYDPLLKTNFSKLYNIKETPTSYLLDKDKTILKKNFKAKELTIVD